MDTTALKRWKEDQIGRADSLADSLQSPSPRHILKMYPEFSLSGAYTTSLDSYVPVWALLPFFEKVIVGILPYLKTEDEFRRWYGVGVKDLLRLHDLGKVEIRILFPSASATTPPLLNPFFARGFPSTARDLAFDKRLLGLDRFMALQDEFKCVVGGACGDRSIDGFESNRSRAFKVAQTAFVQLHALGYEYYADQFKNAWQTDAAAALRWLEQCRLFLIGPVHYSLHGIHCVARSVPELAQAKRASDIRFPAELGRILVDALHLVRFEDKQDDFTLDDCLQVFPDFELARETLLDLESAIRSGVEKATIDSAAALRNLIVSARSKKRRWLRWTRIAASTGVGLAAVPFHPAVGLLAGLGLGIAGEFAPEHVDGMLEPIASQMGRKFPRHLNLLIDIDDAARSHYRDT